MSALSPGRDTINHIVVAVLIAPHKKVAAEATSREITAMTARYLVVVISLFIKIVALFSIVARPGQNRPQPATAIATVQHILIQLYAIVRLIAI